MPRAPCFSRPTATTLALNAAGATEVPHLSERRRAGGANLSAGAAARARAGRVAPPLAGQTHPDQGLALGWEALRRSSAACRCGCAWVGADPSGLRWKSWRARWGCPTGSSSSAKSSGGACPSTTGGRTSCSRACRLFPHGRPRSHGLRPPVLTLDHQGAGALVPARAGIKVPVAAADSTVRGLAEGLRRLARSPRSAGGWGAAGWGLRSGDELAAPRRADDLWYEEVVSGRRLPGRSINAAV